MSIIARIFLGSFALAGCQTIDVQNGSGDIYFFKDGFVSSYKAYRTGFQLGNDNPRAFAFDPTTDTVSWNSVRKLDGVDAARNKAIIQCEEHAKSGNCRLFDVDGVIVWTGLDPKRKKELLDVASKTVDLTNTPVIDYQMDRFKLSSRQIKLAKTYIEASEKYDASAFFVSANAYSTGWSFYNGTDAYQTAVQAALVHCKQKSEYSDCYLFAADGKPINKDAVQALGPS
ncbi:hypothetical protein [Sneathiella aquimaris]|uniref:hypothetical protein n=1 Tax=Sneathiella aquimaris TaxID=2599305 RepID=UPI00146ABC10|nr:hypothetical protein [Sneathiella aquimaris]